MVQERHAFSAPAAARDRNHLFRRRDVFFLGQHLGFHDPLAHRAGAGRGLKALRVREKALDGFEVAYVLALDKAFPAMAIPYSS
jgi:hypothetical protein